MNPPALLLPNGEGDAAQLSTSPGPGVNDNTFHNSDPTAGTTQTDGGGPSLTDVDGSSMCYFTVVRGRHRRLRIPRRQSTCLCIRWAPHIEQAPRYIPTRHHQEKALQ